MLPGLPPTKDGAPLSKSFLPILHSAFWLHMQQAKDQMASCCMLPSGCICSASQGSCAMQGLALRSKSIALAASLQVTDQDD